MNRTILLAEDDATDAALISSALNTHHLADDVVVARDGVEALDYLYRRRTYSNRPPTNPVLLTLDLKMPRVDGFQVLRLVKLDAALRTIPVVVITSSRHERDSVECYRLGVDAYVLKPVEVELFTLTVKQLTGGWLPADQPHTPARGATQ